MRNIIQELIVKGDLFDRKISLVNWNEPKEWTFVRCGNGHGKKPYSFVYYKMTVSKTGKINFEEFDAKKYPQTEEWICLDQIFRNYNKDNKKKRSSIECIVYNNLDEINIVYQTLQYTLPDVDELSKKLGLSDSNRVISKNELLEYLDEFLDLHVFDAERKDTLNQFKMHISAYFSQQIPYKNIFSYENDGKKKSYMRKAIVADFVKWVSDTKKDDEGNAVLLHPQLKNTENLGSSELSVERFFLKTA